MGKAEFTVRAVSDGSIYPVRYAGEDTYVIDGLEPGNKYTLEETKVPNIAYDAGEVGKSTTYPPRWLIVLDKEGLCSISPLANHAGDAWLDIQTGEWKLVDLYRINARA